MDVPHLVPCPVCQTRMCTPGTYRCSVCVGKAPAPAPAQPSLGTCDRHSNARAIHLWVNGGRILTLCGHCHKQRRPGLEAQGFTHDYTDLQAWQTQAPANA